MKRGKHKEMAGQELQKFLVRLLLIMAVSVVGLAIVISVFIVNKSSEAINDSTSKLFTANSTQLTNNIESYIEKVESTAALIFSDEFYYLYDATDDSISEYDKIQHQNAIADRITDLAIMDTYADFGVVYANNKTVGWISNSTKATYSGDSLYEAVSGHITNERTDDGWFMAESEEHDRLYYVKRINKNAVLLASIYNVELGRVFELPEELKGMNIRLIDENMMILYSSDKTEIGKYVPLIFQEIVGKEGQLAAVTQEYLIDVNSCRNGWRLLCTMSMADALREVQELRDFALYICIIIMSIFLIVVAISFKKLSNPVDGMFADLQNKAERDGLSGLLNKISFEQHFDEEREEFGAMDYVALAVMDVDHFKSINDTLGHAYGDQFIVRTARVVKDTLGDMATVGRIGGDEFAILFDTRNMLGNNKRDDIIAQFDRLSEAFLSEFKEEHERCNVSLSVGIYYGKLGNQVFQTIYRKADAALYKSKENGRNRYTVYEEDMQ